MWSTRTNGWSVSPRATVQTDGNFVVYGSGKARWSAGTRTGAQLKVQDDGNLVLYTAAGKPVWASGTRG